MNWPGYSRHDVAKGDCHVFRNAGCIRDQLRPLGDWPGEGDLIHLMHGAHFIVCRLIIPANSYNAAMRLPSSGEAGKGVGMAGTGSHGGYTWLAGNPGPDIGHKYGGRFVARIDDLNAGVKTGIVDGIDGAPTQAEKILDALLFESLHDQPAAFYFLH